MSGRREFRSLASILLDGSAPECAAEQETDDLSADAPCAEERDENGKAREAALFYATVREAIEARTGELLADIAADVLARELQIAPPDIDTIARRAIARLYAEEPLRVRVHPDDATQLAPDLPLVADEGLLRGDVVIELRGGAVDLSLGVRLEDVLELHR